MRRPCYFAPYVVLGAGCSDANQHTYAQAAVATVAAVGAVGLYRAVTNDCWARCRPGYLCNEESGLCERGECLPGCEVGTHCVRDAGGEYRCKSDLDHQAIQSSLRSTTALDAGLAGDAGPLADGSPAWDAAPPDAEVTSSLFEQR